MYTGAPHRIKPKAFYSDAMQGSVAFYMLTCQPQPRVDNAHALVHTYTSPDYTASSIIIIIIIIIISGNFPLHIRS